MTSSTYRQSFSNIHQLNRFIESLEDFRTPEDTEEQSFSFDDFVAVNPKNHSYVLSNGGEAIENIMKGQHVPLQWKDKESGMVATQVILGSKKKEVMRFHKLVVVMLEHPDGEQWFELSLLDEDTMECPFGAYRPNWVDESLPAALKRFRKVTKRLQKVKK